MLSEIKCNQQRNVITNAINMDISSDKKAKKSALVKSTKISKIKGKFNVKDGGSSRWNVLSDIF